MIFILGYIISFFSFLVILFNNPVNALFSLALVYFFSSILLLNLNIEFLSLILVIVYLGALLILFLFILMLSHVKELEFNSFNFFEKILIFYIIISIINAISKFLALTSFTEFFFIYNFEYVYLFYFYFQTDLDLFIFLYTDYFVWFFLITLILFISVISSLFLLTNKNIDLYFYSSKILYSVDIVKIYWIFFIFVLIWNLI